MKRSVLPAPEFYSDGTIVKVTFVRPTDVQKDTVGVSRSKFGVSRSKFRFNR